MSVPIRGKVKSNEIEARQRAVQALELRKTGIPFRVVAERLGYADESGARKAVASLLSREEYEAVDDYRLLELERLDKMFVKAYTMASKGHLQAIDRVMKIMDHRAKLLGLYAPAKSEHEIKGWRTQAIADIKAGTLTYDAVARAFDDDSLAAELFREAGVLIDVERS